jgi:hypothetical protein
MSTLTTIWAQDGAGFALVMGFALLCVSQTKTASILLAAQSAAVALAAVAMHQPIMAAPPLILAAAVWSAGQRATRLDPRTSPLQGPKLGVGVGALLTILCQSQGNLALPLAVTLLAVLLAATRTHKMMRVVALVAMQNGLVLAACLAIQPHAAASWLVPLACLILPLPLVAFLLAPSIPPPRIRTPVWLGWVDLALSLAVLAATLVVPLDPIATVFAPLLGLDGVIRSEVRRRRRIEATRDTALTLSVEPDHSLQIPSLQTPSLQAPNLQAPNLQAPSLQAPSAIGEPLHPAQVATGTFPSPWTRFEKTIPGRGLALLSSVVLVLAVSAPNPTLAWLALPAAAAIALLPIRRRRWDQALLASLGTGFALLGLMAISATPSLIGYACLLFGVSAVGAVVPDLAVVSVILLLRVTTQHPWPPTAQALGLGVAVAALLACAAMLTAERPARTKIRIARPLNPAREIGGDSATGLLLCQTSIAAVSIYAGGSDGRFAAVILLILTILTRSAARLRHDPATPWAIAGLGGVPPLGVFPALILVVTAIAAHNPWLLLPLGVASIPILSAAFPSRPAGNRSLSALRSIGWLPLLLALIVGYCLPDQLSRWLHIVAASGS